MFERYQTPSLAEPNFRRAWADTIVGVFREPADADYVDARIMWRFGRKRAFSWSAAQAIEKYIKAFLLFNGFQAKFRHDFAKSIPILRSLFGPGFGSTIEIPRVFEVTSGGLWIDSVDFWDSIELFAKNGSSAGRYGETRLSVEPYAIHILDHICFSFRKITIDLTSRSKNDREFQKNLLYCLESKLDPKLILGSARHHHQGPELEHLFSVWDFELSSSPPTLDKYHSFTMKNKGTVRATLLQKTELDRLKDLFEKNSDLKM